MRERIVLILLAAALTAVPAHSAVLVQSPNGVVTTKTTLAVAASSADCAGKRIVITSPQVVTTAIAWPPDRELSFDKGGYVTFTGSGALTGLPLARPEFFGKNTTPGTTAMTTAIDKALAAASVVDLSESTYATTGGHVVTTQHVIGKGPFLTKVKKLSGTSTVFSVTGTGGVSGLTVDANGLAGSAVKFIDCVDGAFIKNAKLMNVAGTSYALSLNGSSTINQHVSAEDVEYKNNYSNIFVDRSYYSTFRGQRLFNPTSGKSIQFGEATTDQVTFPGGVGNGITDIKFYDVYIEGGIDMTNISTRDILFDGVRARLDSMTMAFFKSNNTVAGKGGECAQILLKNLTILRNDNTVTYPIFQINNHEITLSNVHIYNAVSNTNTGWSVILDSGTNHMRLADITVESPVTWKLFADSSNGGAHIDATNINYTQGLTGSARWNESHVSVRHSNLNHSINTGAGRYYTFEHILGDVDLTNASNPVLLTHVTGTVTDPQNVSVRVKIGDTSAASTLNLGLYPNFANNAAALSGGLAKGDVYRNGDVLQVVH